MFKLTIVTPEKRIVLNQEVEEVTVPGYKGELNILPGHAPLITILTTGPIRWKLPGVEIQNRAVASGGYCQVSPEGVNVLANVIDLPEEIDVNAKNDFLTHSEKKMLNDTMTELEFTELMNEMARARADIDLVQGTKA